MQHALLVFYRFYKPFSGDRMGAVVWLCQYEYP